MQREYPSHVLYVLSEVLFSCVCIKCVLTLVFTHSSSRDRMYPKLFVIYPWLRIVSSIFVSSFLLLCGQNVMLQLLRLEGILNRKHTGFWADLNDIQSSHPLWSATFLTLWWRDENAVFEARCEGISWAVSRRGSLHFWRADFVSDWKVQFVKDESAVIKSNIYAVREKEFYTLSANGIFFTSLWENKNSIHHLPRPYTVIWACLYNTLCYVKASLSWPGCGWLVSWINNASPPPTETSHQMTYSSPLLRGQVCPVCGQCCWMQDDFLKDLMRQARASDLIVSHYEHTIFLLHYKYSYLVLRTDFIHSISPHLTVTCACWIFQWTAIIICPLFCFITFFPWVRAADYNLTI